MPTYQYTCRDCDNHFEQVQAFSDPSLTVCPQCGGHLRKVYGSVGVVFKGSGFYRTDSRSGSGKASLTADHKAESHSGNGSGESGKPAAATTTSAKTPVGAGSSSGSSGGSSAPAKAAG